MKSRIHYTHKHILNPQNPITVHLIGAGGTGSQVLTALTRISHTLTALNHPGLHVTVWDDDEVTRANLGRQLFADAELGLNKASALVNRVNRFMGYNWKAQPFRYTPDLRRTLNAGSEDYAANIIISCVDTVKARHGIAEVLKELAPDLPPKKVVNGQKVETSDMLNHRDRPYYWLDFGNSQNTGQVILATCGPHPQPASTKHEPVGKLPYITDEFAAMLEDAEDDDTPSCSLAEALTKQDLFINPALAQMGMKLLWSLFREGMTETRGMFLNMSDYRSQPLPV